MPCLCTYAGRCPARHYLQKLVGQLFVAGGQQGDAAAPRDWTKIITHRLPLSQGVEGYRLFDSKADGCVKVVLDCR